MQLKTIFAKPVDRPIEGVIKADDDTGLKTEVDEYVLTNELAKRLQTFLDAYNKYEKANGVWISGFFGSGKSHLLKMVSLLLANRSIGEQQVLDSFLTKCDDAFLQAALKKAVSIPSESILFNIDQKADVISKSQADALLSVFVKVFDEHCGYYGKQSYIAHFERQLDEDGLLDKFKTAFAQHEPQGWDWGRMRIARMAAAVDKAYAAATGQAVENVMDRFRSDYKLSIEDFANQVKKYIDGKGKNFRLNFFVDEAGQYIADNTKLMTNLQTVAESLATKCNGQAWVIVTAQEDMNAVIGEMDKQQGNDFSKIQARFANRMKLTSADVSEVIQKRLLKKNEAGERALEPIYVNEQNNFRTLFDFTDGAQTYKNYQHKEHFINCYPFVPYQFELFQLAIKNLSEQNAFEGKHSSVGERSMLGVFQDVAVQIANHEIGEIATFDLMFGGISAALKGQIQSSITLAERQLDDKLAIRLLKALFLVKYVREFKPTIRNLCVLMTSHFEQDMTKLRADVETALNLLETQVYIQRNGELYEFLTDEEKDVEQEIKNTEIDTNEIANELAKIVFDQILKTRKLRHTDNKQDFDFSRKLDDRIDGRQHELAVHVISPFHENSEKHDKLKMEYMGNPELLVVLPSDDRLIRDLTMYKQTAKYASQNISLTKKEAVKRILTNKQLSNQQRYADLTASVKELLGKSTMFVAGGEIESRSEDPSSRIQEGFDRLVIHTYPNLKMLRGISYAEANIEQCLNDSDDGLFGNDATAMSEAETEALSLIHRNSQKSIRTSIKALTESLEKKPFGWSLSAIQCTLAKLIARGKVEARSDSEVLEGSKLLSAIKNTRQHPNVLLEPQIEFSASQVRRLKDFYEQFFDAPPKNSDAKPLGYETAETFKDLHQNLSLLAAQAHIYPFLSELSGPAQAIGVLAKKSFKFFLTEFEGQSEELLDLKENLLHPIREFMSGSKAGLYKEAKQFIEKNETNFDYIDGDEGSQLKRVLGDAKCYAGNAMRDVKSTLESLKKKIETRANEERASVEKSLIEKAERIRAIPGYESLSAECKSKIDATITSAVSYIKDQALIAVVRESGRRFEEDTYQQLLEKVDRTINQPKPTGDTTDPSPEPTPPPTIALGTIKVEYSQPWLTTDTEVDAYVEKLSQAMKSAITDGKRIQL